MKIISHIEYLEKQNKSGRLAYIITQLEQASISFEILPYSTGKNVRVVLGQGKPQRVAIASHFDTVPRSPGANDNGSAIAICLEMAIWYQANPLENLGLDIFFFDEEELQMRGSQAYLEQYPPEDNFLGVFNLEMVGQGTSFALWNLNQNSRGKLLGVFERASELQSIPCRRFDQIITNYADHESFRRVGVDDAFSITCISDKDLVVAQQYYIALAQGASIGELQQLMQAAPLFAHYHSPTDKSIYLDENCLQMTLKTLKLSLELLISS